MKKSEVSEFAKHVDISRRPNGFMLVRTIRKGPRFSYAGCAELRVDDQSTSFYYALYNLNPHDRSYEFTLFYDGKYECPFFDANVTYLDGDPMLIKPETIKHEGDWTLFEEEITKIFHMLIFESIIECRPPVDTTTQKPHMNWVYPYDCRMKSTIEEHVLLTLSDIIKTMNMLSP